MSTDKSSSDTNISPFRSAMIIWLAFAFPAFVALFDIRALPDFIRPTSRVTISVRCADIGKGGPHSLEALIGSQATQWASNWNASHYTKVITDARCSTGTTNDLFEDDLRALIGQATSTLDSDTIYQIDLSWARSLSDHLLRLDICPTGGVPWTYRLWRLLYGSDPHPDYICINRDPNYEDVGQHFPSLLVYDDANTHLISMPFFADIGLLYYNTNLVKGRPQLDTWENITKTIAEENHTSPGSIGYLWQGAAYEALVLNLLEWIGRPSTGDHGVFYSKNTDATEIVLDHTRIISAIRMAREWISGGISPRDVLSQNESDNLEWFQKRPVMFMRNWPRAWSELIDKNHFAVSLLPGGGALGGWQLGISKHSKHPEMLASLLLYLTGKRAQEYRAINGYLLPTIRALYEGAEVGKHEFFASLANQIRDKNHIELPYIFDATSIARPSYFLEGCYMEFSELFSQIIHSALEDEQGPFECSVKNKLNDLAASMHGCITKTDMKLSDLVVESGRCEH